MERPALGSKERRPLANSQVSSPTNFVEDRVRVETINRLVREIASRDSRGIGEGSLSYGIYRSMERDARARNTVSSDGNLSRYPRREWFLVTSTESRLELGVREGHKVSGRASSRPFRSVLRVVNKKSRRSVPLGGICRSFGRSRN